MAQRVGADRFVGRTDELRELLDACRAPFDGLGSLTVVAGEAGIGKTRLCTEMAALARRGGTTLIMARCWDDGGAPALWPWQPILDELCGPDAYNDLVRDAGLPNAEPDRFARFAAVTEEIAAACRRSPTCLVVDDIHAADTATLLLLRFVARSLHRLKLALVLTRRTDEPADDRTERQLVDEIEREATLVTLHPFDRADTAEFLAGHGVPDVDADMLDVVLRVTEGHPLFLRRIASGGPASPLTGLGSGLRRAIDHAVAGLATRDQVILRIGAVLGTTPTVAEAAAVADVEVADVLDALRDAEAAGLVVSEAAGRFSFSHELVRAALVEGLRPTARMEAHARAVVATVIAEGANSADALVRRAHHALAAAPRSVGDARRAVDACRIAAGSLIRSFAYEQADRLLSAAIDLHEPRTLGSPPGQLLLEWAQAALLCGRLSESRDRFARTVAVAEQEGQPALLAEALLGLGGYWLNEARQPVERARVLAQQHAVLEALPDDEAALRCRLAVRLAADAFYNGDAAIEPMYEALDAARACGDADTYADALSFCHHALMQPQYTRARLELADELVRVAAASGHGMLGLLGLCWRTLDLIDLGDPRAGRALEDLRQRADALACQAILYVVGVIDVMLQIRAGRLAEAEAMATACYELGAAVGEVDAFTFFGAQMALIRWLQGRTEELVGLMDSIATSPDLHESDFAYLAAAAAFAFESGNKDRARLVLDELTGRGLASLPRSSTWLVGMMVVAELASALHDAPAAREVYELLFPFAELPVVPSLGVACFGSTHRSLGLLARAFGDHGRAVDHLRQAVADNRRLPNLPLAAIAQADLAVTLMGRDSESRRSPEALRLLADAAVNAEALGMTARASGWRRRVRDDRALVSPSSHAGVVSAVAAPPRRLGTIRREGRGWHVAVDSRHVHVGNLVGLRYLVQLLVRPRQAIPAITLVAHSGDLDRLSRQELLDDAARTSYLGRVEELADDLAEAEANADIGRAERLRAELDTVLHEVRTATGLGGRPRSFAGPDERARTAVRKAIMRAIAAIDAGDRTVGTSLRTSITTGYTCSYTPDPDQPITWTQR